MDIALDSSVLVALLNPSDVWHAQAIALLEALNQTDVTLIYFDCVVVEAISAAARRLHERGRGAEVKDLLHRLESHAPRDLITWILPDVPRLYPAALNLIHTSSGELNFNDALIALVCRERSVSVLASFDPDFDSLSWLRRVATASDVSKL